MTGRIWPPPTAYNYDDHFIDRICRTSGPALARAFLTFDYVSPRFTREDLANFEQDGTDFVVEIRAELGC